MNMQTQELIKIEDIWDLEALFPAQNLKACHLPEEGRGYVIERIDPQHHVKIANDDDKVLPAIYLQGEPLPFVLNKTNVRALAAVYGKRAVAWIGRPVVLYPDTTTDTTGKQVPCVRVSADKTRAALMNASAPVSLNGARLPDAIEVSEEVSKSARAKVK